MNGFLKMTSKVIIITGASRGLGKFLSEHFFKNGHSLILISSNIKRLKENTKNYSKKNNQALHLIEANYLEENFEKKIFYKINQYYKKIDVLINNAGIQEPIGPFKDVDFKKWQENFKVNFISPALITRYALTYMNNDSGGSIINLSGGGSSGPRPNFSSYACSKTALVRFTETLSHEFDEHNLNININAVAPGAMPTDMMKELVNSPIKMVGKKEKEFAKKVMNTPFNMQDVAELCEFLISPSSRGISGKLISLKWDNWKKWTENIEALSKSDLYTLRRITARDRNLEWGDL